MPRCGWIRFAGARPRTLVEIHLAEGNRAPAVRSYLEVRERPLTELGIEPSTAMRALVAPVVVTGQRRPASS